MRSLFQWASLTRSQKGLLVGTALVLGPASLVGGVYLGQAANEETDSNSPSSNGPLGSGDFKRTQLPPRHEGGLNVSQDAQTAEARAEMLTAEKRELEMSHRELLERMEEVRQRLGQQTDANGRDTTPRRPN